jgi:hypothetical protein
MSSVTCGGEIQKILKRKEFSCEGINAFNGIIVNHPKLVEISVKKPRFFSYCH